MIPQTPDDNVSISVRSKREVEKKDSFSWVRAKARIHGALPKSCESPLGMKKTFGLTMPAKHDS